MEEISLLDSLGPLLVDIFGENMKLILISADLAKSNKVEIIKTKFPERFFQVGIAEQDMVGMAVGFSHENFIPIIASYAAYAIPRAYEQIRNHVGIDNENIKIIGTHSSFTCYNPGDRSYEDIALARSIDNMIVLIPSDYIELKECLKFMVKYNGGCYLRLPHYSFATKTSDSDYKFELGKPHEIKTGKNLAIFSYGLNIKEIILSSNNLENSIYSFPSITNLDEHDIVEILTRHKKVIVVEDHKKIGSLYLEVLEIKNKNKLDVELQFQGIPDKYHQFGKYSLLQNELKLDYKNLKCMIEKRGRK